MASFGMPNVIFKTVNYVRLTVPAVRAMFPVGTFPGGVVAHLPLKTRMRIEVDGVIGDVIYDVTLRDSGSSSVCVDGLPFEDVKELRRIAIRRLDEDTLVLELTTHLATHAQIQEHAAQVGA